MAPPPSQRPTAAAARGLATLGHGAALIAHPPGKVEDLQDTARAKESDDPFAA